LRLAAAKATGGSATVDTLAYLFVHNQDVPAGSHTVIAPSFTELTATDFSDLLPQLTTLSTVARIVTPTVPVSISPDSIHVVSGDTPFLDVVVDLSQTANGTALGSYTAAVTWDSTVMRLDSATSANFPTSQFNPQNAGWLKLSGADATGAGGANVVVARLFFRFVNDTFPAQTNIGLSVTELHAAESFADLLPGVQVHGGYAFIGGVVRGDLDESGVVDALDAQLILQGAVDLPLPNGLSGLPFGDADCDGVLRALDAQIVLNYVVDNDVSQFCVGKIQ
jgi:hypothetical protein